MIIVEPHTCPPEEVPIREMLLTAFGVFHKVQPVSSVQELIEGLDGIVDELKKFGSFGLRRMVLFGHADGPYASVIQERLMPGESLLVYPLPVAWSELWKKRTEIAQHGNKAGYSDIFTEPKVTGVR